MGVVEPQLCLINTWKSSLNLPILTVHIAVIPLGPKFSFKGIEWVSEAKLACITFGPLRIWVWAHRSWSHSSALNIRKFSEELFSLHQCWTLREMTQKKETSPWAQQSWRSHLQSLLWVSMYPWGIPHHIPLLWTQVRWISFFPELEFLPCSAAHRITLFWGLSEVVLLYIKQQFVGQPGVDDIWEQEAGLYRKMPCPWDTIEIEVTPLTPG